MEQKKKMRLNIIIKAETHFKLKELAAKRHVSLTDYVLFFLNQAIENEEKYT